MSRIYLKGEVERAMTTSWQAFAEEHPRLAAVLDRQVLIEEATQALRSDGEFNRTLQRAQAAGMVAECVRDFVEQWLRRLL
ncbi:MAG TPA: hypothetical protein PLD59_15175 [Tepidisphaeraceae bacterium]|nr:hypothetical protein [Tepidisphaeraceae bacterium]